MHSTQHIISSACLQLCQQSLSAFDVKKHTSRVPPGGRFMSASQGVSNVSRSAVAVKTRWSRTLLGSKGEMWNS